MARQVISDPKPFPVNRTPAPKLDTKHGGESYGQANDVDTSPSVPPGARVITELAKNLEESVSDPVKDRIIAGATHNNRSGFAADIMQGEAADKAGSQTRHVSAQAFPDAHGMSSARTRQPSTHGAFSGKIPSVLTNNQTEPVRMPAAGNQLNLPSLKSGK